MQIQVAGSGCLTCKKLYEITQQAVTELKVDAKVEYLGGAAGIAKIVELGALSSPILVVDGRLAMVGFVPNIEKVKKRITKSAQPIVVQQSSCPCGGSC